MTLCPTDRYVVLRRGIPVYTTNECYRLIAYLWGLDIKDRYVVLDYERPYPVDTPDLCAWVEILKTSVEELGE
jgi:hypothetical protein